MFTGHQLPLLVVVEMFQDRLEGLFDVVDKAKEPLDKLDSKAWSTRFNQIS